MIETHAAGTRHARLRSELLEIASAAVPYAAEESDALIALLDHPRPFIALGSVIALEMRLARLRAALLEVDSDEAANLWHDLAAGTEALRAYLVDAFHESPSAVQQEAIGRLRACIGVEGPDAARAMLESAEISIAAAGDFKRGKSTVINALLGRAALPMRVAPATAVPCAIRAAETPEARVHFDDGRPPHTIPLDELERYACIQLPNEERELAFSDQIAQIEIGLPWTLPPDVVLLDLPGLNEEAGRSEMAADALDGADMVLMVLSATQLLAEDELLLLDQLWNQGHRAILFAVNFRDRLEGGEEALVRERAARLLAPYRGALEETIFLISARQALEARLAGEPAPAESGLPALESRLRLLLDDDREMVWREARLRRVIGALEDLEQLTCGELLELQEARRHQRMLFEQAQQRVSEALIAGAARIAAAEDAIGAALRQLEELQQRHEQAWQAVDADLEERCRKELLPWVWQEGGIWLRERLVAAIREVNPEVTPRPEGYLRIRVPSGLRFSQSALLEFYRAETAREWERFTGEHHRHARQVLDEQRALAVSARRDLDGELVAQQLVLAEEVTVLATRLKEAGEAVDSALPVALAASRRLAAVFAALDPA